MIYSENPRKISGRKEFGRAIWERVFYFCKLSGITIEEYCKILKEELEERGFKNDFLR